MTASIVLRNFKAYNIAVLPPAINFALQPANSNKYKPVRSKQHLIIFIYRLAKL